MIFSILSDNWNIVEHRFSFGWLVLWPIYYAYTGSFENKINKFANKKKNIFSRYKNLKVKDENICSNGDINYELADHCITLKKTGVLCQVESLRTMSYNSQFSTTTEATIKQLPRSASGEIFDRVKSNRTRAKKKFYSILENNRDWYSRKVTIFRKTWSNKRSIDVDPERIHQSRQIDCKSM